MAKGSKAAVEERRDNWSQALSKLDPAFFLVIREIAPQTWEICPPNSVASDRGFPLRDKLSYLMIQERWVTYQGQPAPIIGSWRYQFCQPDGKAYSGNMEWIFRYELNALPAFGGSLAESHLNVHHPHPIGNKVHYPGPEDGWEPREFVEFLLRHFPAIEAT